MLSRSGDMNDRLRFESRSATDDGYGNEVAGPWTAQFTRWASVWPMRGGEDVIASRLQGVQPFRVTVYSDSETRTVTPEWRAVDTRSGAVYAIKAVVDEERRKQFLTLDCVLGQAQ